MITWWSTEVECASAIARLEREQQLTAAAATAALARLREFAGMLADLTEEEWTRFQQAVQRRPLFGN